MTDYNVSKRFYLTASIKTHLERLDDVELAVVLSWLKTGGLYREPMLATLDPQKIIEKSVEITEAAKTEEAKKDAEAEAAKDAERAKHKSRVLWQSPLAAATPK